MEQQDLIGNELVVNEPVVLLLRESSRWARFLSIVGFVMTGLMLVAAMVLPGMMAGASYSEMDGAIRQDYTATGVRINFIILAILLFVPCLFLFRFAIKMREALTYVRQDAFEDAFKNLKSTFKFYGILTIVVMGIYALALAMVIVFAIFQV